MNFAAVKCSVPKTMNGTGQRDRSERDDPIQPPLFQYLFLDNRDQACGQDDSPREKRYQTSRANPAGETSAPAKAWVASLELARCRPRKRMRREVRCLCQAGSTL